MKFDIISMPAFFRDDSLMYGILVFHETEQVRNPWEMGTVMKCMFHGVITVASDDAEPSSFHFAVELNQSVPQVCLAGDEAVLQ